MRGRRAGVLIWAFALVTLGAACGPTDLASPPSDSASGSARPTPRWIHAAKSSTTTTTTKPLVTTTTAKPPVTTTTAKPPPTSADMPTRANTGPTGISGTMTADQFLTSGVCDHQRITEQVRDEIGRMLGRTFTVDNCAFDGGLYYANYGSYPDSQFPTVSIRNSSINGWLMFSPMRLTADRVYVTGAYWAPCPDCGAQDHQANQTQRAMPVTVTNSYFFAAQPPPPPYPYHSEALHVVGAGIGYSFTNVRFTQEGPMNNNITGAIKFTGRDSTFRNVYFDWGGTEPAAYHTTYFEGVNIVIDGCHVAKGNAGLSPYEFPTVWSDGNGYVVAPLTNCVDFDTGAPVG